MRKIKSVKTTKPYYNGFNVIPIGTPLIKDGEFWQLRYKMFIYESFNENVIGDYSYILDIEYEPEGFEFRNYPIALPSKEKEIVNSELNRLADWCDGQSEKDLPREYFVEYDDISLLTDWTHDQYFRHGLKFNSKQSAKLFILELNKPENSDYKKYFIELLKKTRL